MTESQRVAFNLSERISLGHPSGVQPGPAPFNTVYGQPKADLTGVAPEDGTGARDLNELCEKTKLFLIARLSLKKMNWVCD